jgi:hypothetical protein
MVLDNALKFCAAQAITASAISTNILDGKTIRDFGRGNELYLNIYLTAVFTSTVANELSVQIVSSSGADPGSSDVFNTIFRRSSSLLQQAGLVYRAPWPVGVPYERVGLYFLATTALAAGTITAFLTLGGAEDQVLTT